MVNKSVKCGKLNISNTNPFTLIAGPCQLENEKHALEVANEVKKIYRDDGEKLTDKRKERIIAERKSLIIKLKRWTFILGISKRQK